MKEFLQTFKFLLSQNLSLKHFFHKLKNNKRQRTMYIFVLIVLLMSTPSFYFFLKLYNDLFNSLKLINQESFFLVIAILLLTFIILLFGFYQVIAYFYFSNEVKILTPYPVKTKNILLSKFFVIYVWELLISLFLVLPFLIIYGVNMNLSVIHWVYLMVCFILLPIIPLIIVGFLTIIIMKLTNVSKSKDALRMIGMFILLISIIALQLLFNKFILSIPESAVEKQEYFQNFFSNNTFLSDKVASYYPIIGFTQNAITQSFLTATLNIVLFIGLCMVGIYLFGIFLQNFFLKSYLAEQDNPNRKLKIQNQKNSTSIPLAFSKIDFITLLKVPIYAFNALSMVVILPILLLIYPLFFNSSSNGSMILSLYNQNREMFWLIVAVGMAIFSTFDQIAATTFSREGKTNWVMRTLPISAKDHILGRFFTAFFVQLVFSGLTIGVLLFIIKTDFLLGIIAFIISNIASIPLMFVGILIDLKRPMLNWDNPQQAVKQNLNVLAHMGIGLVYGVLMFLTYKGLVSFLTINVLYFIYFIISLILAYLFYQILSSQFEKSLVEME